MRIIAGTLKGRKLELPKEAELRPTSDAVRGAIYSTLQSLIDLNGAHVLDLYAGSGALAIEALSRGAKDAVFVERDKRLVKLLEENLEEFGIALNGTVVCDTVERAVPGTLAKLAASTPFDLILIDPPYAEHPGEKLLADIMQAGLCSPEAILVVESGKKLTFNTENLPTGCGLCLRFLKDKSYGDTVVRYFRTEIKA